MVNFYRKFLPNAISFQMKLPQLIGANKQNDRTPLMWDLNTEAIFQKWKEELAKYTLLAHPAADAELANLRWYLRCCCFRNSMVTFSLLLAKINEHATEILHVRPSAYIKIPNYCHFWYMIEGRRCYLVTDHWPLIFAFPQKLEKTSPRRIRHFDFIDQFTTGIRYTLGITNFTTNALSRVDSIDQKLEYTRITAEQQNDEELQHA